ncbi:MAG: hypothetical protein V1934_08505 [Methanobacteriota archaeon]
MTDERTAALDETEEILDDAPGEMVSSPPETDGEQPADEPAMEDAVDSVPKESEDGEETTVDADDAPAEDGDAAAAKQGFVKRYWMLIAGFVLALVGIAGVLALRLNYAQVYILGETDPYTGIGTAEPLGHGASIAPFIIGVILVMYWGMRTPPLPEAEEGGRKKPAAAESKPAAPEEPETSAEPEEFGHEHLPADHLSAVEKIKHLTKAYAQGKISEGLYNENIARFEAEMDAERGVAKEPEPQQEEPKKAAKLSAYQELKSLKPEVAKNEEDHLPPHHLSPEEKIDHLTKSYAQGKVSRPFFDKNLKKFEAELKREKDYLPPHEMHPRQKLEQLEDAFKMGVISQSTYDKNKKIFEEEAENSQEELPEMDTEFKAEVPELQSLDDDLDSLLKEVVDDEDSKKPSEKRKKTLMEELEELEDL